MKLLQLLKEYSEGAINRTIERWKEQKPDLDPEIAKKVIQRFDQIKQGLSSKLDTIALSDELRQGNKYLNIDHYSIDDMITLLRSIPEKDSKIKKDAIKKFMDKEKIDKGIATHYVIRFMNARRQLKYAIDNGTEDGNFSSKEVKEFIPNRLLATKQELDPRAWEFNKLEIMLDALYPYRAKVEDDDSSNTATVDADIIYKKDGLEIYKGDAQHKCVSYNPTVDGRKQYGWCIAQPGNSNYDYYRFQSGGTNRMFYFVFNRNKDNNDNFHAFVIHVGENNQKYWVTNARNSGDVSFYPWSDLQNKVDEETWNLLKDKENLFKYVPPSKAEISAAALRGKKLTPNDFRQLDYDTKEQYIQSNAGSLSKDLLEILDKDLKNLAINYGQKFPYKDLKSTASLAKRYAIFRFRHTNYSDEPIPLPYIKYLDDKAKQKYLETFDDNLNFDYVNKYFGDKTLQAYIEEKTNKLDYVQKEYIKYIKDNTIKNFYILYSKLVENWEFNSDFGMDEKELENSFNMPEQRVDPKPLFLKDFQKLDSNEIQTIINSVIKFKGEKYSTLVFALPYVLKKENEYLFLIPTEEDSTEWNIINKDKQIIDKFNGEKYSLKDNNMSYFYPDYESYNKLYDYSDLQKDSLNENKFRTNIKIKKQDTSWEKQTLMNRAGLL